MLPKLDLGGRGTQEKDPSKTSVSEAVVALPRLRLLRQVTSRDGQRHSKHGHHFHASPRSPATTDSDVRRGRGMVRPIRDKGRSPSPMRQRHPEEPGNTYTPYTPHHDAQQRVRQHMRQKRRKAKEEEELRILQEKERQERILKSMPQVEAHRKELARKAAELHHREKVEKEIAAVQQEQLASARRERVNRYMRPDAINAHLGRLDNSLEMSQSIGEDRRPAGSSVRALRVDDEGKDVIVSGSFATGSVRARHKVMLSPRRQGGNARARDREEGFHEAQVDPDSVQGSEHAALDSDQKEQGCTAVDASPTSTEVPSPAIGMTGPAESQHDSKAELAVSTAEVLPEVAEIPQLGDEAQSPHVADEKADGADINVSSESTSKTDPPAETSQESQAKEAPAVSEEIPTGTPEQETVDSS